MCFGGGKSAPPAPLPPAPQPGVINVDKVAGDPAQAAPFQGTRPPPNLTGRAGGELLLDAANKAPKNTLG